jgi:hypothetical protein
VLGVCISLRLQAHPALPCVSTGECLLWRRALDSSINMSQHHCSTVVCSICPVPCYHSLPEQQAPAAGLRNQQPHLLPDFRNHSCGCKQPALMSSSWPRCSGASTAHQRSAQASNGACVYLSLVVGMQVVLSTSAAFLGPSLPFIPLITGHEDFVPQDTVVYAAGCVLLPEVFANITCQVQGYTSPCTTLSYDHRCRPFGIQRVDPSC